MSQSGYALRGEQNLATGTAAFTFGRAGLVTGGFHRGDGRFGMTRGRNHLLFYQNLVTHGAELTFCQTGFRTGGIDSRRCQFVVGHTHGHPCEASLVVVPQTVGPCFVAARIVHRCGNVHKCVVADAGRVAPEGNRCQATAIPESDYADRPDTVGNGYRCQRTVGKGPLADGGHIVVELDRLQAAAGKGAVADRSHASGDPYSLQPTASAECRRSHNTKRFGEINRLQTSAVIERHLINPCHAVGDIHSLHTAAIKCAFTNGRHAVPDIYMGNGGVITVPGYGTGGRIVLHGACASDGQNAGIRMQFPNQIRSVTLCAAITGGIAAPGQRSAVTACDNRTPAGAIGRKVCRGYYVSERIGTNGGAITLKGDFFQCSTSIEGTGADFSDTFSDSHFGHSGAIVECVRLNGYNAVAQGNFFQRGTAIESILTDSGDLADDFHRSD